MRTNRHTFAPLCAAAFAAALVLGWTHAPLLLAQTPQPNAAATRPPASPDPRVLQRTYHFADTNENLPYALYVSSKVSHDQKNPLIVALHGLGGDGRLHDGRPDGLQPAGLVRLARDQSH